MNEDKINYGSEDLQRTMEVPTVRGSKRKEPLDGIVDPWHLNRGGPPEEILKTIADKFKVEGDIPKVIDLFEPTYKPAEKEEEKPAEIPEVQEQPANSGTEEEPPKTEIEEKETTEDVASDATRVLPVYKSEETAPHKTVEPEPEKPVDVQDTAMIPVSEPEAKKLQQEKVITREQTTAARIWPPVLFSSVVVILACFITLIVGIMPVFTEHGIARGLTQIISPVLNADDPPAYTNVLLVGVDKDGYRTDTMMVATYSLENKSVSIMQLSRDTYVEDNGRTDKKLNSAYFSGIEQVKREIRMAYGIEIHKYVEVDTAGFRNVVDAIGGVEFDVPINMYYEDPYQDLYINLRAGRQVLDGEKAEQFVRYRQYPRGDLARMEAQRAFVSATLNQLMSVNGLSNINELIDIAQNNIRTDLTFDEIYAYCVSVLALEEGKIQFVETPGSAVNLSSGSYFIVDYDMAREVAQQHFYATEETMAYMKRIVVKEPEPQDDRDEEDQSEDQDDESGRNNDDDEDRENDPDEDSDQGSAVSRPDEPEPDEDTGTERGDESAIRR